MKTSVQAKTLRPRLTCTNCHQRKIKCDKTIPCERCIKRGYADTCARHETALKRHYRDHEPWPERSDPLLRRERQRTVESAIDLTTQTRRDSRDSIEPFTAASVDAGGPETEHVLPWSDTPVVNDLAHADTVAILEFSAWGRKKDYNYGTSPDDRTGPVQPQDSEQSNGARTLLAVMESSRDTQLDLIESLLPSQDHIFKLVDYHSTSLLWYHGSYSSVIFREDLAQFLTELRGNLRHPELSLQWLALLFAILTGSLTCAPVSMLRTWGFSAAERRSLPARWYDACVTCLNLGQYIERHMIHSVQAIATLTISAHVLGHSNSQSVLLASAGRIAQSLGLHRLDKEDETATLDERRRREAGRRVFNQLCTQDWFQIPFSESYSLNPRFCTGSASLNCNDDMVSQPQSVPTQSSYCNYRYEIARLMPRLLDDVTNCNTLFTKYEQVLHYDDLMRKLATAYMPTFLSANAPVDSDWPVYVTWGRRSMAICAAHKIIMIHRKFLGLSFTNSAFTFTRRTCIAASKTILKEAFSATDEEGPVLWIEQAFTIAAGIILSLDTLHRSAREPEFHDHARLVADAIAYLKRFEHSCIAERGVRVLRDLEQRLHKGRSGDPSKRAHVADPREDGGGRKRARYDIGSQSIDGAPSSTLSDSTSAPGVIDHLDAMQGFWGSMHSLHGQGDRREQDLFDDLLSFQF